MLFHLVQSHEANIETEDGQKSRGWEVTLHIHEDAAAQARAMPPTADRQSLSNASDKTALTRALAPLLQRLRGE